MSDPPLAALAATALAAQWRKMGAGKKGPNPLIIKISPNPRATETTLEAAGRPFAVKGAEAVARCVARLSDANTQSALYGGADAALGCEIEAALAFVRGLENPGRVPDAAKGLNAHLATRSVMCGSRLSLADCAAWASLSQNPAFVAMATGKAAQARLPNLARWWGYVTNVKVFSAARSAVEKAARARASAKKKTGGDGKDRKQQDQKSRGPGGADNYKIPIEGAKMGKVVTRFPPEPSGYLHIGHAKAALLNDFFAKQYKGKCLLRFDDTNPSKEKQEFVDNILKDLKTLGIDHQPPTTTSQYFETILGYADKMLAEGKAYVDDTPVEEMRKQRMDGTESAARKNSVAENQRRWAEMKAGTDYGTKCVMRAKISMKTPNKCMRDPAMYRCKPGEVHHKTGDKYKVYPTYDFACPIVDALEGVTHALRTTEYKDREPQYMWFIDAMGLRKPMVWEYSRLSMQYTVMSKRKLKWFVETGKVQGWNDPRFPTIQGIIRRGLTVEALRKFILSVGASKSVVVMSWDKLWAINKQILDPKIHRFLSVSQAAQVPLRLDNVPARQFLEVRLHPKDASIGMKRVPIGPEVLLEAEDAARLQDGEEFTLQRWGNCIIRGVERDASGNIVALRGSFNPKGNYKTTKNKLTWVCAGGDGPETKTCPVTSVEFDYLITKSKIEDGDQVEELVNPRSRLETKLIAEAAIRNVRKGQHIQLERRGYYICEKPWTRDSPNVVLFLIPTGKVKAMSSLSRKVETR